MPNLAKLSIPAVLIALALAARAEAQSLRPGHPMPSALIAVEGEAAASDTLPLLFGLGQIRADLQLGLLARQEGLAQAEATHFAHARTVVLPQIASGLAAAGVADLEPLLKELEASGNAGASSAAYHAVEAALLRARSTLAPPAGVALQAVAELTRTAASRIDLSGTTGVQDYKHAWALLMVARGELDLLARSADRDVAKLAGEMAVAFDDLILFMPDPGQSRPVAIDRTQILELVARLPAADGAT